MGDWTNCIVGRTINSYEKNPLKSHTVAFKYTSGGDTKRRFVMSNTEGEEMDGVERVVLSEDEKRVLDIYDQLEALQLEIALLKSQGILSHSKLHVAIHFVDTS